MAMSYSEQHAGLNFIWNGADEECVERLSDKAIGAFTKAAQQLTTAGVDTINCKSVYGTPPRYFVEVPSTDDLRVEGLSATLRRLAQDLTMITGDPYRLDVALKGHATSFALRPTAPVHAHLILV